MSRFARGSRAVFAVVLLCSLLAPTAFAASRTGDSPFRRAVRRLIARTFDEISIPPGFWTP